jgi:hypothetical protein
MQKWPLIAGDAFAEATRCERVEGDVLYIRVATAAWRQEAVYRKQELLARIRNDLGCHTIKDIVFY